MSYLNEGHHMSIYGPIDRSPAEVAGYWKETIKREDRIDKNHIAIKGNGTSVWPGVKPLPPDAATTARSFLSNKETELTSDGCHYDLMFHIEHGYNSKLHRDDRQHTVGLDVLSEELKRSVPVRSSSEYGRRVHMPIEDTARGHVRIDKVMKGFYRDRGTGIPNSMDEKREDCAH